MSGPTFDHLRLTRTDLLGAYLSRTAALYTLGNVGFPSFLRTHCDLSSTLGAVSPALEQPFALYHSWLPGFVGLGVPEAAALGRLRAGRPAPHRLDRVLAAALGDFGWLADDPANIADLVTRGSTVFPAMQNPHEEAVFLRRVAERAPKVVVEIGTARGGMLCALTQVAHRQAVLVSVDLPLGQNGGGQTDDERQLFASFCGPGQRLHCMPGDSHSASLRLEVESVLAGSPIDLLFIDGDHRYEGVRADLELYGPLVAPSGCIALHDICLLPEAWGERTGTGRLWCELQGRHGGRLAEIIDGGGVTTPDRQPGQRPSWGIGLLEGAPLRPLAPLPACAV